MDLEGGIRVLQRDERRRGGLCHSGGGEGLSQDPGLEDAPTSCCFPLWDGSWTHLTVRPPLLCGSGSQLFCVSVTKTGPGPGVSSLGQGLGIRNGLVPKCPGLLPHPQSPGTDLPALDGAQVTYHTTPMQSDKISSFSSRICNLRKILLVVSSDHFCF